MLSPHTRGRILRWLLVFSYCLLIFIQSSHPSPVKLPGWNGADKLLHMAGYALLGVLLVRALETGANTGTGFLILAATSLAFAYGISDETHQAFVPARDADVLDALADGLGGFLGAACYLWVTRRILHPGRETARPDR